MQQETTKNTYWIPESNMEKFKASIDKINRKVAKRGFPQFTVTVINKEIRNSERYVHDELINYHEYYFQVEVEGVLPKIEGNYTLAGVLEKVNNQNLVYCTTKEFMERINEMKSRPNHCDHCNINRKRNKIYVLMNKEGKFVQVGSACMKDFTKELSAEYIAHYYESLKDIFEQAIVKPIYNEDLTVYPTNVVIQHVYHHTKEYGFKGVNDKNATYILVNKSMHNPNFKLNVDVEDIKKMLSKIAEYDNTSEYLTNLNTLINEKAIRFKDFRFLASYVQAYKMLIVQENRQKEKEEREKLASNSKHQGEVGEVLAKTLKVTKSAHYDSTFGGGTIINFIDNEGNFYTWFTSFTNQYDKDELYEVTATIKEHNTYQNAEITVLTRCKTIRVGTTETETVKYRLSEALDTILSTYDRKCILQSIRIKQSAKEKRAVIQFNIRVKGGVLTDTYQILYSPETTICKRTSDYNDQTFMDVTFDLGKSKNTLVVGEVNPTMEFIENHIKAPLQGIFKNKPSAKILKPIEELQEEYISDCVFEEYYNSSYITLNITGVRSILGYHEELDYHEYYDETHYTLEINKEQVKKEPYNKRNTYPSSILEF